MACPHVQAKKAIREVPKDDEEVERQEEGEIDRGFTESSSSSEDDLTEAGAVAKELNYLLSSLSLSLSLSLREGDPGTDEEADRRRRGRGVRGGRH